MSKIDEKAAELVELQQELGEIELNVLTNFTLADAIRAGSLVSTKAEGWGTGDNACAMSAAVIAARAAGFM